MRVETDKTIKELGISDGIFFDCCLINDDEVHAKTSLDEALIIGRIFCGGQVTGVRAGEK